MDDEKALLFIREEIDSIASEIIALPALYFSKTPEVCTTFSLSAAENSLKNGKLSINSSTGFLAKNCLGKFNN